MIGNMGKDAANAEWNIPSRFDNMFIIDRNVDLLTLMPMQLTYEGLVDECFGIQQATVKLPADRFPNTGQASKAADPVDPVKKEQKERKITLNSSDELYAEIRDKNFSAVGPIFSSKTKFLSAKMGVSVQVHQHTSRTMKTGQTYHWIYGELARRCAFVLCDAPFPSHPLAGAGLTDLQSTFSWC